MQLVIQLITNQDDLHVTQNNLGRENNMCETNSAMLGFHET